jgi:hypothetical protein
LQHYAPRIEERTKVLIRAALRGAGAERDACILDISSRGMLLTMADPPPHGGFVEVVAQGHELVGQVEWAKGRRFGIRFRDRINHAAYIAGYDGPIVIRQNVARLAARADAASAYLTSERLSAMTRFVLTLLAGALAAMLLADVVGQALQGMLDPAGTVMAPPVAAPEPEHEPDKLQFL